MTSPMINKAYRSTIAVNAGVMTPPNPKCCTNASVLCRDCYAAAQGMVLNNSHDSGCHKKQPTWNAPHEKCEPLYTPPLFEPVHNVADSYTELVHNSSAPLYSPRMNWESEPVQVRNVRPSGKATVDPVHDSSGPLYSPPMIW